MPLFRKYAYFYDSPRMVEVSAFALDEQLPDCEPNLIVMDIEGSEYFAIKGMQRLLSRARVLAMEFVPHHLKNVSGVSVEELLRFIVPHFNQLYISSKDLNVPIAGAQAVLRAMYDAEEEDDGVVFMKTDSSYAGSSPKE